jgi:hypothetical protein
MNKDHNEEIAVLPPRVPEDQRARAKIAADILEGVRLLHTQAEYSNLGMVAYFLRLGMIEAEEAAAKEQQEE